MGGGSDRRNVRAVAFARIVSRTCVLHNLSAACRLIVPVQDQKSVVCFGKG